MNVLTQSLSGLRVAHPPRVAVSEFVFPLIPMLLTAVILFTGCASPLPLAEADAALLAADPQKAAVVIYRSTAESWSHRPIPARIHIDGVPFMRLLGGEYVQIYLPGGPHEIGVEYSRDCELVTHAAAQAMLLQPGQVLYLEIVPSFGDLTWIYCSPFQLVPFPMPGSSVELFLKAEDDARKNLGKAVEGELLLRRRITR